MNSALSLMNFITNETKKFNYPFCMRKVEKSEHKFNVTIYAELNGEDHEIVRIIISSKDSSSCHRRALKNKLKRKINNLPDILKSPAEYLSGIL